MLLNKHFSISSSNNYKSKVDPFSDFPIGLIILENDGIGSDYQIFYSNAFANHLLSIPRNKSITVFKENLSLFKKWEINHLTSVTLKDLVFPITNTYKEINNTFISSTSMIYAKIRYLKNKIHICIDNYIEERKSIQENLAKSLNHQHLMTLYHELNNPLNALIHLTNQNLLIEQKPKIDQMKLLIALIKIFIDNFIWFFRVMFEANKNIETILNININLEFLFRKTSKKFELLFNYKNISHEMDYSFLNDKIIKSNEDYLINFLKAVFFFLYHAIPRSGGFRVTYEKLPNQMIRITFINHQGIKSDTFLKSQLDEIDFNFKEEYNVNKTVQTLDMTMELLIRFSEILGIKLKIYEVNNKYLSFIIPYIEESKDNVMESTEELSPQHRNKMEFLNPLNSQIVFCPLKQKSISCLNKSDYSDYSKPTISTMTKTDIINRCNKIQLNSSEELKKKRNLSFGNQGHRRSIENGSDPYIQISKLRLNQDNIDFSNNSSEDDSDSFDEKTDEEDDENEEEGDYANIAHHKNQKPKNQFILKQVDNKPFSLMFSTPKKSVLVNSPLIPENCNLSSHNMLDPKRKETFEFSTKCTAKANLGLCDCNDLLIVDDEFFNISAIRFLLKKYNMSADSCYNGEECLEKITQKKKCTCSKNTYKLIFLDIMMPVMDGLTTAKKIQEMKDNGQIKESLKIIVISAHIDDNLKNNLAKYSIVKGFVSKPVKGSKLSKIIDEYYNTEK